LEIKIENISKKFDSLEALQCISFSIQSGSVFGLVGPNGSGKTTLMRILSGLEKPTTGRVLLDGVDITKNPNVMKSVLGYLPQDVAVYPNLTAYEFLCYIAGIKGLDGKSSRQQIDVLLNILHLEHAKKRRLSTYSGGMKQRVGIACALLGNPKVIIVDEPSVGLDPEERVSLRKLFETLSKTCIVLLSTHIISDIGATASHLAVIQNGVLMFNGTQNDFVIDTNGDMESAYLRIVQGGRNVV
jgi:ABC-2 type transport system ATP-binding protein